MRRRVGDRVRVARRFGSLWEVSAACPGGWRPIGYVRDWPAAMTLARSYAAGRWTP